MHNVFDIFLYLYHSNLLNVLSYYMNWGWGGYHDGLYIMYSNAGWTEVGLDHTVYPYAAHMTMFYNFNQI